jgi:hypothetical protein
MVRMEVRPAWRRFNGGEALRWSLATAVGSWSTREKRRRWGAWPLGRKGFRGDAHWKGGKTAAAMTILGEATVLRSPGWMRSMGGAREVLHGRASGEGERKKWSVVVSAPF